MFYAFLKHQAPVTNWRRTLIDCGLDLLMLAAAVLAVFTIAKGTLPLNIDMLRVTLAVLFVVTTVMTVKTALAHELTREHMYDQAGVTLIIAILGYVTRSTLPIAVPSEFLLAIYLNVAVGLFFWGKVATHVPLTGEQLKARADRRAQKEARSTADASEGPRASSTSSGAVEPVVYVGEFVNDQGGETAYSPDAPRGSDEVPVSTWLRPSSS